MNLTWCPKRTCFWLSSSVCTFLSTIFWHGTIPWGFPSFLTNAYPLFKKNDMPFACKSYLCTTQVTWTQNERPHDKNNKLTVRPAKTQINPDLSLRWAHSQFIGFVMRRLKCALISWLIWTVTNCHKLLYGSKHLWNWEYDWILEQLKRESEKSRRGSRPKMLYKGLNGAASIPPLNVRKHHCLAFQIP